jgi:hypothetical protein
VTSFLFFWDPGQRDEPLPVWLLWESSDPYAVELILVEPDRDIPFEIARELLVDGLAEWAGEDGFVQVGPHDLDAYITVRLPIDGAQREFYAERAVIDLFVDKTCKKVPLVQQRPIAEAALDRWLAGVVA